VSLTGERGKSITCGPVRGTKARRCLVLGIVAAGLLACPSACALPEAPNCPIFPAGNVWNKDVSALPVAANSAAMISAIGASSGLHPDFGSPSEYGIPYNVVPGSQPKVNVAFDEPGESDHGPYPIPANPKIEGGGDHHILTVDKDACRLYELYDARRVGGGWAAYAGAIWDLRSNALRPDGWTSADAAGLPILPGLVRHNEATGTIDHALRFTAPRTRSAHIYPARHDAGSNDPSLPPMGLRLRLKASVDIGGFAPQARAILTALKRYGMILADNGSPWYITGASDPGFDDDDLRQLSRITGNQLEVVNTSGLVNTSSGAAASAPSGSQRSTAAPAPQSAGAAPSPKHGGGGTGRAGASLRRATVACRAGRRRRGGVRVRVTCRVKLPATMSARVSIRIDRRSTIRARARVRHARRVTLTASRRLRRGRHRLVVTLRSGRRAARFVRTVVVR
jgi:hypothetical protein